MSRKFIRDETIAPDEAARRIGITPNYVRQALRDGSFPVGWAYCPTGSRWTYVIPLQAFEAWMAGTYIDTKKLAEMVADEIGEKLNDPR